MKTFRGSSLIEVLISLLLLSVLLLGIDAMQIANLNKAKNNYFLMVAEQQINNLLEQLVFCQISLEEINLWNQRNEEVLPHGRGEVEHQSNDVLIKLFWGTKKRNHCDENKMDKLECLQLKISC